MLVQHFTLFASLEGQCFLAKCRKKHQLDWQPLRRCAASFAAALLLHTAPVCAAEVVQGPARAVDGDTLVVGIFVLLADQPQKDYAHQHSM